MSAASGDGASTAALNTAFCLSQLFNGSTVLVDMDYQFGMVAKHIDLQNQYGIRDLFDHPERGIDATLIKRMVGELRQAAGHHRAGGIALPAQRLGRCDPRPRQHAENELRQYHPRPAACLAALGRRRRPAIDAPGAGRPGSAMPRA